MATRLGRVGVIAVVTALLVPAGCGADRTATRTDFEAMMRDRLGAASRLPSWYHRLDEALPNVGYLAPDDPVPQHVTDVAVVGRIVDVEKGMGFVVEGDDAPGGTPVPFDRADSLWKTVHLTVDVDGQVGSAADLPDSLDVGLGIDGDADFSAVETGLVSLGQVVMFLYEGSPVFAYDPGLYAILEDGGMLATVSGGRLALPFLEPERAATLLAGTGTLAQLQASGTVPRTIELQQVGGLLLPPD